MKQEFTNIPEIKEPFSNSRGQITLIYWEEVYIL